MLLRKPKRTKCFKLQIDYWRIWRNFFVFPVDSRCTFWEQTFSILRILLLSSIIVGYPGFFTQILCLLLLLQCTQYRSKVSYHCLTSALEVPKLHIRRYSKLFCVLRHLYRIILISAVHDFHSHRRCVCTCVYYKFTSVHQYCFIYISQTFFYSWKSDLLHV